jgi:ubiquitin-activating enzyme E1
MGVKRVELFDREATTSLDLSGNFYLTPADVGAPRAARCVAKVAELNEYAVCVEAPEPAVTAAVVARFNVVVAADQSESEMRRLGALAREVRAVFIAAEGRGAFGRVFSDFGDSFVVEEVNDEPPAQGILETVTNDATGIVTVLPDTRHGLETGDFVTFSEVGGAGELNGCAPREVRVISPSAFSVGDLRGVAAHTGGGLFKQVKQPREFTFAPIDAMLRSVGEAGGPTDADFLATDWGKLDRAPVYHAAFAALHAAAAFPAPGDEAAARALVEATRARLPPDALPPALAGVVLQFARAAHGHLAPLCAALGGVAAQEVIKAISHKFAPIRQWLFLDAAEALPAADAPLPAADVAPTGSRYDGQIVCFGRAFQERIGALRYFLVGAGAIGCEMLKNWAAMGVGCGSGMVYVTDMDHIEKSNLSRQFLFRAGDIGKPKSIASIFAATRLNEHFRAQAFEAAVGPKTEDVFDDNFWTSLSGVCTALDNIQARLYVDDRCVHYGLPMLESGTLGTKGNTQVVVPRLTENYGATRDPPEQGIPVCTLKDFPFKIEHTLQFVSCLRAPLGRAGA